VADTEVQLRSHGVDVAVSYASPLKRQLCGKEITPSSDSCGSPAGLSEISLDAVDLPVELAN
jgi:hypothetical protein